MSKFRSFILQNINPILIVSTVVGLFIPGVKEVPSDLIIFLLAAVIFFSCSKIDPEDLGEMHARSGMLFYVLRFVVIPAAAFYITEPFSLEYAYGVLLITLMPVGVASAAMTTMVGGNASLALFATIVAGCLGPFMIPLLVYTIGGAEIDVDLFGMFITICQCVFLPAFLYFGLVTRSPKATAWVKREAQVLIVLMLGVCSVIIVAAQREVFLAEPLMVLFMLGLSSVMFFGFYLFGWMFAKDKDMKTRKTYAVCSGINNIALAIGLAAIYFSPKVTVFTVAAEVVWILSIPVFRKFLERVEGEKQHAA